MMACITRMAAIETTTAIWDYDPDLPKNRIMNGSLPVDAVAALRTLSVKVDSIFYSLNVFQYFRFNHWANTSNISISCRPIAA